MTTRRSRRTDRLEQRRLTIRRVRALLVGGLVLGVGATATLASWTDPEYASTQITAGTFSIESRTSTGDGFAEHNSSGTAATLPLNLTGIYPGSSAAAWIQIRTAPGSVKGTVNLIDAVAPASAANSIALRDALTVRVVATSATTTAAPDCTTSMGGGTAVTGIDNVPALSPSALAANGADVVNYCFIVTLPADTPNAAQGGSVTPVWEFSGTTG
ncbi:SipW-dependent-type signal peptide-containing protein [uncultured Microbacterium sp.]|uniref:SipW-dependent-type signal peptide-containing protein n=1 Tax=uncultured Microbacterium sp. TaxID=191216 RepID=UPI00261D1BBD|nr:SipW-dependent-type signal peptide-containing protein [uncultured Microbacterium sp.]